MKISVVTPSYNQLSWLRLCVASVTDQAGVEVEHIVQDGGSDSELTAWAAAQPQLRFYEEPDSGMYDAVNRGLHRATGDVCAYLNCDEQYLPGTLRRVADFFAQREEVEVVFGDIILVSKEAHPLSYRRSILPTLRHIRNAHLNTPTCGTFFRRSLLERGFYFDPEWKAIGDIVWMERLLEAGVKMATIAEALAVFAFTGSNLGATSTSRNESVRWKAKHRSSSKPAKLFAIAEHRFRKWTAGAYQRRDLAVEIYTHASPTRRERIAARRVGYGWPN